MGCMGNSLMKTYHLPIIKALREAKTMTELNKTLGQKQIEAARFAASHVPAEFLSSVSTVVKAKEDWEGGPVTIWQATVKYYSGEAFDAFPDPQSKEGDGENNPCKFKVMEPSGKDGKFKEKEKDYYNIYADNLPPAVTLYQEKDWLERLGNDKMKTDGIDPQYIAEYGGASHSKLVARDARLAKVKNRINYYRATIKAGFGLRFQLEKVNELSGVHAEVVPTADGKGFENRVRVRSTMVGRELEDNEGMTIKAFMKLDAMVAFKNGATFHALLATRKRQQEEAEGNRITTAEEARNTFLLLHDYLDTIVTDSKQEMYSQWVKFLNTKAGDDTFMTLMDIRDIINGMIDKTSKPGERRQAIAQRIADAA